MKYFLDCGSNLGQGYEYFKQIYGDDWNYILFEPNKNCYNKLVEQYGGKANVVIYNCAVYIEDCTRQFYFSSEFCLGGSIISNHNSKLSENVHTTQVSCVNILKMIEDLISKNNEVVIKFDVESSEYDILEAMIRSGLIFKVQKIYCEFHSQYMKYEDRRVFKHRERKIRKFVKKNKLCFELWK